MHKRLFNYNYILLLGIILSLSACSSIREDYPKSASYMLPIDTSIGLGHTFNKFEKRSKKHAAGESGVSIIRYDHQAFSHRMALCELSQKSLDLQYYIWDADYTGRTLAECLFRAADRGVRVRVLLDDYTIRNRDREIVSLSGHPNIYIRAFNPFKNRHALDAAIHFSRINHRTHNKIFIADSAMAIIGGRNIADHYFGTDPGANFRDLDVGSIGPVVADIGHAFDSFWNSDYAIPYAAFVSADPTEEEANKQISILRKWLDKAEQPYPIENSVEALKQQIDTIFKDFIWAPTELVYDNPNKVRDKNEHPIATRLTKETLNAKEEILIENAYFVPTHKMVTIANKLKAKGVKVRVLTNSLSSNDVASVHSGYAPYRRDLLNAGVHLYEFRPDSKVKQRWAAFSAQSKAKLHTKAMVLDKHRTVIGSYNLDPRSARLNSEMVMIIDNPKVAKQAVDYMNEGVHADNAYKVVLENDRLRWVIKDEAGEETIFTHEPETSIWKRMTTNILKILPISSQL